MFDVVVKSVADSPDISQNGEGREIPSTATHQEPTKNHTNGPTNGFAVELEEELFFEVSDTSVPVGRGKKHPPLTPMPPKREAAKPPIDIYDFSSDDDFSIEPSTSYRKATTTPPSTKKPPAKRGRQSKADREALMETDNPRPSTSAALVREMMKIKRAQDKANNKDSPYVSRSYSPPLTPPGVNGNGGPRPPFMIRKYVRRQPLKERKKPTPKKRVKEETFSPYHTLLNRRAPPKPQELITEVEISTDGINIEEIEGGDIISVEVSSFEPVVAAPQLALVDDNYVAEDEEKEGDIEEKVQKRGERMSKSSPPPPSRGRGRPKKSDATPTPASPKKPPTTPTKSPMKSSTPVRRGRSGGDESNVAAEPVEPPTPEKREIAVPPKKRGRAAAVAAEAAAAEEAVKSEEEANEEEEEIEEEKKEPVSRGRGRGRKRANPVTPASPEETNKKKPKMSGKKAKEEEEVEEEKEVKKVGRKMTNGKKASVGKKESPVAANANDSSIRRSGRERKKRNFDDEFI